MSLLMRVGIGFLCLCVLLVSGCATTSGGRDNPNRNYVYQPPVAERGKVCVQHCQQDLNRCQNVYRQSEQACLRENEAMAAQQNNLISAFTQTEDACVAQENTCKKDYRICYELCGGKVI